MDATEKNKNGPERSDHEIAGACSLSQGEICPLEGFIHVCLQRGQSTKSPLVVEHQELDIFASTFALFTCAQSVLRDYLSVDWNTEEFADLLFGDYLSREEKVGRLHGALPRATHVPADGECVETDGKLLSSMLRV